MPTMSAVRGGLTVPLQQSDMTLTVIASIYPHWFLWQMTIHRDSQKLGSGTYAGFLQRS